MTIQEQFVWAVFNSGDPLWTEQPCMVLFASKHTALDFVRNLLHRHWHLNASEFSDDAVEHLMFDTDVDRYLHLYELKVHEARGA